MAGDTVVTIVGNLAGDPELRFTPSGAAVANFTVASTSRRFDRQTSEWVDEETLWMRCSVWRQMAENVAESLAKGMPVIVQGRLKSRSWEDKDSGQTRTVVEMDVDNVGASLRNATVKVTRNERQQGGDGGSQERPGQGYGGSQERGGSGGPQGGWGQQGGGSYAGAARQQAAQGGGDPWGGQPQGGGGWGGAQPQDPPF